MNRNKHTCGGRHSSQAGVIRKILTKENYVVFQAEDGNKALEILRERRLNLILSDIVMPGMDGYEFCRKVKGDPATKDIPFILLTALSDPGDIITGLQCGADNFIIKPFESDLLRFLIKHHLGGLEPRKAGGGPTGLDLSRGNIFRLRPGAVAGLFPL